MPNDVPVRNLTMTFGDASREEASSRLNVRVLADYAAYQAAIAAYEAAVNDVIAGAIFNRNSFLSTRLTNVYPTDNRAQRENKWLVRFQGDTTLNVYTFTIPTADPGLVDMIAGTDFMDISQGDGLALAGAIEALVDTPDNVVETITVLSIEYVGRNL